MRELKTMRLDVTGPLARLTLDRQHVLNAGDARWVGELNAAVGTLAAQPDVRVVVLTGAGRAFSTGVDLKALAWSGWTSSSSRPSTATVSAAASS